MSKHPHRPGAESQGPLSTHREAHDPEAGANIRDDTKQNEMSATLLKVELMKLVEERAHEEKRLRLWQSLDREVMTLVRKLLRLKSLREAEPNTQLAVDQKGAKI